MDRMSLEAPHPSHPVAHVNPVQIRPSEPALWTPLWTALWASLWTALWTSPGESGGLTIAPPQRMLTPPSEDK